MSTTLRTIALAAIASILAVGGAYAGSRVSSGTQAAVAEPAEDCDVDGVRVSYSISYEQAIAGYAVDTVRVLEVAAACAGHDIEVVLRNASGAPLRRATGTAGVTNGVADLRLARGVPASDVQRVDVALRRRADGVDSSYPVAVAEPGLTAPVTMPRVTFPRCASRSGAVRPMGTGRNCRIVSNLPRVLIGGSRRDVLSGGPGNDRIAGRGGADLLRGGRGNDRLDGGAGNDRLEGGLGNDNLIGGPGRDVCIGGPGRDRFRSCEVIRR